MDSRILRVFICIGLLFFIFIGLLFFPLRASIFGPRGHGDGRVAQFAMIAAISAGPYVGVYGKIAVWQPHVEPEDTSLSVIGCRSITSIIYAGYGVSPTYFGDNKSRLFLATWNGEKECWNDAKCSDFVQVDFTHRLNDILDVSDYDDPSKHRVLEVFLYRELKEDRWWLSFNSTRMGYLSEATWGNTSCDNVYWGGIVDTTSKPNPTQMGNGHLPTQGTLKTGEITYAESIAMDGRKNEKDKKIMMTSPQCYNFQILGSGNHFLYGGSGNFSSNCT